MHESPITFQDEIRGAPTHLLDDMQASALAARFGRQGEHVAGAVAQERLGVGAEPGHDCLTGLPGRHRVTGRVQHFQDDALTHQQHLPGGAFMGGKTDIPAAEFVRHRHSKYLANQLTLVRKQGLTGSAHHPEPRQLRPAPRFPCPRSQQGDAAGITVDADRVEAADRIQIGIHIGQ